MLLEDLYPVRENAKMIWARQGNKAVRKYRCTSGAKKGRIVSTPSACGGRKDMKKSIKMKQTVAKKGSIMRRKAKKTKRVNPVSKRIQQMNKAAK